MSHFKREFATLIVPGFVPLVPVEVSTSVVESSTRPVERVKSPTTATPRDTGIVIGRHPSPYPETE